jgi:uncharacterized membrane protein YfcA
VDTVLWLAIGVLAIAFLYSSVGHAGASGYIAVMSLLSVAPEEIRQTALALNILVATIGTVQFWAAGHFSWRLFWPFALLAIPMAYVGGLYPVPDAALRVLLGVTLLWSSAQLLLRPPAEAESVRAPRGGSIGVGAGIGLLAGLTGTGGGIFLTPLLLFLRWAPAKTAAAVSALFILVNSIAGLFGSLSRGASLPGHVWVLLLAALIGGYAGSHFGARRYPPIRIKRLLAAVLLIAGIKLVLT